MPPGMWKIFNHGQIHGLVHIIIIFSPHPHKVRDAVRDLRRFFCFHLSSSLFYSYTKLHHFFLIPGMERAVFSTLFRKRWQKHRAAFLFSKARPRKSSGCKASLLWIHAVREAVKICMKLLESDSRCHIMNHMLLRALPSRPVRLVRSCSWRRRPTQGLRL